MGVSKNCLFVIQQFAGMLQYCYAIGSSFIICSILLEFFTSNFEKICRRCYSLLLAQLFAMFSNGLLVDSSNLQCEVGAVKPV